MRNFSNKTFGHMFSKIGRLFNLRFYSRIMLLNIVIFFIVAYILAFIAVKYSEQANTIKQLQRDRDHLISIKNFYDQKVDDYLKLIYSLYIDIDKKSALRDFLESQSDTEYEYDPGAKKSILRAFENVKLFDDIKAVLFYKTTTKTRFVHIVENDDFEMVKADYPFFDILHNDDFHRHYAGTRLINIGASKYIYVYGICGSFASNSIRVGAGNFMIAFKTNAFNNIYTNYKENLKGRFLLLAETGDIIYDSDMDYSDMDFSGINNSDTDYSDAKITACHPVRKCAYIGTLLKEPAVADIDGKRCYVQIISSYNHPYIAAHIIPVDDINNDNSYIRINIYIIVTVMAILCAVLYIIAGSISSKRVKELGRAMKRVGLNNLTYRISMKRRDEEFQEIATHFNQMCDELQLTINREYVNEIKKKNAELGALQATINPHFLYNTLEAIKVRALDHGVTDVADMIIMLASLYRGIVKDCNFIPIINELNMCKIYLKIFSMRYTTNIVIQEDIDPLILGYGIPKILLQPILENYFIHGIKVNNADNTFKIHGFLDHGDIYFNFEDNGYGIDETRLAELHKQLASDKINAESEYGLLNINSRIRIVYGESYGLSIDSKKGVYTRITVHIKAITIEELSGNPLAPFVIS